MVAELGSTQKRSTEPILFGVRGKLRTQKAGRTQVNMIETQKREHSRKPDEQYALIEVFARSILEVSRDTLSPDGNVGATKLTPSLPQEVSNIVHMVALKLSFCKRQRSRLDSHLHRLG